MFYFHFHFFLSDENKTEMNEHVRLVGNELNRSGLYQKRSVTGNQVENNDQHEYITAYKLY
jgi:type IV secretory pathway VirB4 component